MIFTYFYCSLIDFALASTGRGYLEGGFKDLAMQELKEHLFSPQFQSNPVQEMAQKASKLDFNAVQALLSDPQVAKEALELLKTMPLPMDAAACVMTACLKQEELQVASGSSGCEGRS